MDNGISNSDLLRLVGVMAVFVGVAWALQILGFGADESALHRVMWVLSAASVAGAGVGAIFTSATLREQDVTVRARGRQPWPVRISLARAG